MRKICTFGIAVTASFTLLQSAEAGSRAAARSFASAPHYSAPHYSAPARQYAGPSRSFSNNSARFNSSSRFSSVPRFQNRSYTAAGPRFSPLTEFRNPTYAANRARLSGNRTEAFNTRMSSQANARLAAARVRGTRAQASNSGRERVFAQRGANWRRNWDRSRDHWWNGRRCHFRNNVWVIYEPLFWYPYYGYGSGYYPYGSYDDSTYYDDSYASDQYEPAAYNNQQDYAPGSRVSDVQSALAREGYYDGPIDGRLGNAMQKALRRYQRDHGLEVTGGISRGVIEALRLR